MSDYQYDRGCGMQLDCTRSEIPKECRQLENVKFLMG